MKNLKFLKVYFSPFKPPKLKLYVGRIAIGVPYFYPRKWVKFTRQDCENKALEDYSKGRVNIEFNSLVESYKNYFKPIPKKIGFSFVSLGYKTKWTDTDYRFEWRPIWSFVFFKWQIALQFLAVEEYHFWECWLYYENDTDKTKSKKERIKQCIKDFPCTWNVYKEDEKIVTDFYRIFLRNKYLKYINALKEVEI